MDLIVLLEKSVSTDDVESINAQTILEQTAQSNLQEFMRTVSETLCLPNISKLTRKGVGVFLIKQIASERPGMQLEYRRRWFSFLQDIRNSIKTNVLRSLGTDEIRPSITAQCIAAIARLELPRGQWPDLINILVYNMTTSNNSMVKEATLDTISLVCKDIKGKVLEPKSNDILRTILIGMKTEEESIHVKIAATNALLHALRLIKVNFDVESERHLIMQLVCESTQSGDTELRVAALKCLTKIVSRYYKYMEHYMGRALFSITIEAMKSEKTDVKLQSIRFWSNVCKKEETLMQKRNMEDSDHVEINVCFFYAMGAIQYLAPLLFHTLVTQDMSNCENKLNPFSAAESCLRQMAACCKDKIIILLDFVKEHIKSCEWRERNAAVVCFGAILGSLDCEEMKPLVEEMLPVMLDLIVQDPSNQVKGSAAMTVGQMHDYMSELSEESVSSLLKVFMQGLSAEPKVAAKVCKAIEMLAEYLFDHETDNKEQKFFEPLVEKLLETVSRLDFYNSRLHGDAFAALNELIELTPKTCYGTVIKTMMAIMNCLRQMLDMEPQIQTAHEQDQYNDFLTQLLITSQTILGQFHSEDFPQTSDLIMAAILEILNSKKLKSRDLEAEAFNTVSLICSELKENFAKYTDAFLPILIVTLKSHDTIVLTAAVNVTNEIVCCTPQAVLPRCDEFVHILLDHLISNTTSPLFKPEILSTVGEISLAIGPEVKKYVDSIFTAVLQQLSQIEDDYDIIRCINFMEQYLSKVYESVTDLDLQPIIQSHFSTMQTLMDQAAKVIAICDSNKLDESEFEKLISTFADSVKNVLSAKECDQVMIDDISDVIKNTSDLELN